MAGGCEEWCDKTPGTSSVEMYDPVKDSWSRKSDLPFPINSAKMEQLNGLPTLVGGFNNAINTQNGILLQYHADKDQWIEHPKAQMRLPRSSAAVFQVPRNYFPSC